MPFQLIGVGPMQLPVAGGYTGPGDVVGGAYAWWGLRAYSLATIGNNCVKLRRDSDDATQDFITLANGSLDVASIATFKGAANLFVDTLYDQVAGALNLVAVSSVQPSFTLSGLGTKPIFSHTSTQTLQTIGSATLALPFTISWIGKRTSNFTTTMAVIGDISTNRTGFLNSADTIFYFQDLVGAAAADNVWHAVQAANTALSQDLNVDGSANAGGNATTAWSTFVRTNIDGAGNYSNVEYGVWPIAFSGGNSTAMSANQHTYWGF